jgi:tetratricopeptide (TPR) repeat protein
MKKIIIFLLLVASVGLFSDTIEEVISQAKELATAGELEEAAETLEKAKLENPNNPDILVELGNVYSKQAGSTSNFLKAGKLSGQAFSMMDKALVIDPAHINAHLYRGILSVNVPKFMGKLKQGIKDLELIQTKYGANQNLYMVSSYYLGKGYQKNEEYEKAVSAYKFIIMYGKETDFYQDSKTQYEVLTKETEADEKVDNYKLGMKYLEANDLYKAVEHLRLATQSRKDDLELHLVFARTLGQLAGQGYDETISEDVTTRAGIAHEVFEVLSHCVELAPGNDEILFLRGSVAVNLPFFVNSLETGIEDMEYFSQNGETDEMKGQASYLLNYAKEMQIVYDMAETGYQAETDEEKQHLLSQFVPTKSPIQQIEPEGEFLQIELTLGYRDQIAPQTAVWIEDENGNYLKTIYISGFAAFVKEHQMHLPRWAESSEFRDIEVVTGASIDCGKHLFYWDLTNYEGEKIEDKELVVKTEICHWPHVQYTEQALQINLKKRDSFENTGDNYLLSKLKVKHVVR